jgi:hypothetical protein
MAARSAAFGGGIAAEDKKRSLFNYWGFYWIRQARNLPDF